MPAPDVFITGLGAFFPGPKVSNDEMEDRLGRIHGRTSRARARVLKQNGITSRHYAIDGQQRTLYRNSEMAALAVQSAVAHARVALTDVDYLSAATTQGDVLVPGFASMVHGELKAQPLELSSLSGVCASGVMALKAAYLQLRAGEKRLAVACASELPSRSFKASRFEAQGGGPLSFDTEFLRWMLSDGAGAAVLASQPAAHGISLRVEWIELLSHAGTNPPCMFAGANQAPSGELGPSWLDYVSVEAASVEHTLNLKQNIRLLDRVVQLGVEGFFELVDRGRVQPDKLSWLVVHHSSDFFRKRIFELLAKGGVRIPEERWFSNLATRGNVGAASLYVLLEELVRDKKLEPGEQILCMVPESGRFIRSYMLLTVVSPARPLPSAQPPRAANDVGAPELKTNGDPLSERLVRGLTRAWVSFEQRLHRVPIVARIESGAFDVDGYRQLLIALRQQVVEGSRWIARAASSVSSDRFELRQMFLQHAREEQADFKMLERDYVAVGGRIEDIRGALKNVGSEALSAWMFHRAGMPDPFDLLGAMFIIEGLGSRLAHGWGVLIRDGLALSDEQVSFLLYHGANDGRHFERLESAIASGLLDDALVDRIIKTAQVTARLYLLQLEEITNP